jgi:hypothetical protein
MDYTVPNTRQEVTSIIQYPTHVKRLHELYRTKHTLRSYINYTVQNTR